MSAEANATEGPEGSRKKKRKEVKKMKYFLICLLCALPVILMCEYWVHDLKKHEGNEDAIAFWRFLQIASPFIILLNNIAR